MLSGNLNFQQTLAHTDLYIDGGGSSLKVFRSNPQTNATELLQKIHGNFNVQSGNYNQIVVTIQNILAKHSFRQVFIGLAGLISDGEITQFKETLRSKTPELSSKMIQVGSDVDLCFELFFPEQEGILVILGTGSVFAAKLHNRIYKVGGYGKLIGDPGSGYSLGRRVVVALFKHFDGIEMDDEFYEKYRSTFPSKKDLIQKIYQHQFPIQELTVGLFELASSENKRAQLILDEEVDQVEIYLKALNGMLPETHTLPIKLYGGLVESESYYKNKLQKLLG